MLPTVYWVETPLPGRLAVMPRPRAGDWLADEVAGWKTAGTIWLSACSNLRRLPNSGCKAKPTFATSTQSSSFPFPFRIAVYRHLDGPS